MLSDEHKKLLPNGAIRCEDAKTAGFYWWLPACANSLDDAEWTVIAFHPQVTRKHSGWYFGPIHPPAPRPMPAPSTPKADEVCLACGDDYDSHKQPGSFCPVNHHMWPSQSYFVRRLS